MITISDPLRAILNREFVDGKSRGEKTLYIASLFFFFLTYILYNNFFNFSIKIT